MAKGIAQRRRLRRALEAARGNLHKIANGKALPLGLPDAPKAQEGEKLPASLRKMLALKELADRQDKKPQALGNETGMSAGRSGRPTARGQTPHGDDGAGPSTSGRQQGGIKEESGPAQTGKGAAAVKGANAFTEQFVERKLKTKKKEYLKRKEEQKRKKSGSGELVVEKELQLRDNVKFGEVVHAPLNVHLKRKHWVDKEKTANERCKEVFLKQMHQAQQRMAGQEADEGIRVEGGRKGAAGGAVGGPAAGTAAKSKKRKASTDEETAELRQQVIDSYRAAKKGGSLHNASVGNATLSSLAGLIGRGGGGKTHTLA